MRSAFGDIWTWTAICADTKLIPSWFVGERNAPAGHAFIRDLADRLDGRIQITSDGLKIYLDAIERAFGDNIDYTMLVKHYGPLRKVRAATARPNASERRSAS